MPPPQLIDQRCTVADLLAFLDTRQSVPQCQQLLAAEHGGVQFLIRSGDADRARTYTLIGRDAGRLLGAFELRRRAGLPAYPGIFILSAVYMIAEKAADVILTS